MRPSVPTGFATGSRPNTRTVPDWALSKPRMCLIIVVLPAPLPPIRPNTPPRGTVSETSSRAALVAELPSESANVDDRRGGGGEGVVHGHSSAESLLAAALA